MKMTKIAGIALIAAGILPSGLALAAEDKAKFYDFSDQLIDGEIKKPTAIYMESRSRARFDKLLRLKKSFRPALIDSAKERTLK